MILMTHYGKLDPTDQSTNHRNWSPNSDEHISNLISNQEAKNYVLFKREKETLVLFEGSPYPELAARLAKSKVLIGALLSSNDYKTDPSISNYYYALIGTEHNKKPSCNCAVKELSLKGWKIVNAH